MILYIYTVVNSIGFEKFDRRTILLPFLIINFCLVLVISDFCICLLLLLVLCVFFFFVLFFSKLPFVLCFTVTGGIAGYLHSYWPLLAKYSFFSKSFTEIINRLCLISMEVPGIRNLLPEDCDINVTDIMNALVKVWQAIGFVWDQTRIQIQTPTSSRSIHLNG